MFKRPWRPELSSFLTVGLLGLPQFGTKPGSGFCALKTGSDGSQSKLSFSSLGTESVSVPSQTKHDSTESFIDSSQYLVDAGNSCVVVQSTPFWSTKSDQWPGTFGIP